MTVENLRFVWPVYSYSHQYEPRPEFLRIGPEMIGLPLFYSEDDAELFIARHATGERKLVCIPDAQGMINFLEAIQITPKPKYFRVMLNPIELPGTEPQIDVHEFIRVLKASLNSL